MNYFINYFGLRDTAKYHASNVVSFIKQFRFYMSQYKDVCGGALTSYVGKGMVGTSQSIPKLLVSLNFLLH